MTVIYIVTLYLVAFDVVQSHINGCPYGWYLSDDESTCYVNCITPQLLYSNVYCTSIALKTANVSYDSSTETLSMPSGDAMGLKAPPIPSCYNVTLRNDQYNVTSDGFIQIAPYLMEIPLKSIIKMTRRNVTLCYPSSPQLLQCDTINALPGSYKILNETTLLFPEKNLTVFLGDFYVNDEAIAFFCAQSSPNVSFTQLPRCNMVVLQHTEYLINKDGSMRVHRTKVTIKNPLYSINYSRHAIVCLPLSLDFLNCPSKEYVAGFDYTIYPNFILLDMRYRSLVDPFHYFITLDSELTTCVQSDDALIGAPIVLTKLYNCFYLLSSFTLLLTVVFKFKMFIPSYHTRCLLCHLVSLIIMYFSLGMQLFYARVEVDLCYVIFVSYYYFNMAAFFWLNVVAYDSWRFFSRMQTVGRLCVKCDGCWSFPRVSFLENNAAVRFAVYNAYSWGLAAILTATILYLDLFVSPFDFSYQIRPYVLPYCFFTTTKSFLVFCYLPLTTTTIVNLVFLALTIRILHRASEGTEMVNCRRRKQVFRISMKLFVLMGFCWTVDCVCYGFGLIDPTVFQMWFLSLGLTSLQGFIVSIIYCAQGL